jgi:hypothetical protein
MTEFNQMTESLLILHITFGYSDFLGTCFGDFFRYFIVSAPMCIALGVWDLVLLYVYSSLSLHSLQMTPCQLNRRFPGSFLALRDI